MWISILTYNFKVWPHYLALALKLLVGTSRPTLSSDIHRFLCVGGELKPDIMASYLSEHLTHRQKINQQCFSSLALEWSRAKKKNKPHLLFNRYKNMACLSNIEAQQLFMCAQTVWCKHNPIDEQLFSLCHMIFWKILFIVSQSSHFLRSTAFALLPLPPPSCPASPCC